MGRDWIAWASLLSFLSTAFSLTGLAAILKECGCGSQGLRMQTSALQSKLSVTPERKENLEGLKLCRRRPVPLGGRLFFSAVQALLFRLFVF